MAGGPSQSWYVKASFGAEWGPMSLETLREMADHGDLARSDLARCGVDADWQPVSTLLDQVQSADAITDLIQQAPDATSVATSDAAESLNEPASEPLPLEEEVVVSVPSKPSQDRRRGLPNWSNYWDSDSVGSENPPPASMLRVVLDEVPVRLQQASLPDSETETEVVAPVHATDDHSDDSPIESTLPSGDFAELDAWKRKRSEQLERLLKIVSDREAKAAEAAEQSRLAAQWEATSTETVVESTATGHETSPESPQRDVTPAATPKVRSAKASRETWEETLDRWQRSLPDPKAALVLLILPFAAWWLWPSSDAAIAESYRAMYFELMELRERPGDKTGMEEFLVRSQAQLDQVIPGLEKRSSPNQPAVQWLLWMGRDCLRPMLKQPRQAESKPELTFNKLMREWQRLNDPNFETRAANSDSSPAVAPTSRTQPSDSESTIETPHRPEKVGNNTAADKSRTEP